jgi:hypothetical protein
VPRAQSRAADRAPARESIAPGGSGRLVLSVLLMLAVFAGAIAITYVIAMR